MRKILPVVCAAGAILAAASVADAQECRGGYRTLPNQVIVRCDDGPYYYGEEAPIYAAPAPRVYVERQPSYYDDYAYPRYPYGYGAYPGYYYDDEPYYRHHRHYSSYRNCFPFRALSAVIPGVAPMAC